MNWHFFFFGGLDAKGRSVELASRVLRASGAYYIEAHSLQETHSPDPLTEDDLTDGPPTPRGTTFGQSPLLCTNSYSAEIVALIAAHLLVPASHPYIYIFLNY